MENQNTPLSNIKDQVNGIVLGPNRTENGGQVLDVSNMSPEAAGNQLNQQALQLMQQQTTQNQQILNETREQNTQVMNALTQAITTMGQNNAQPQVNPMDQYQLNQEDEAELGTMLTPVQKQARFEAERVKQETLSQSQGMINQYSQAQEAKLAQLDQEIGAIKRQNQMNFKAQLDSLASSLRINMDGLATNPQWQSLLDQPISPYDQTSIRQRMQSAAESYDISFFSQLLNQFASSYGTNAQITGQSDMQQQQAQTPSAFTDPAPQQQQMPANAGGQPALNSPQSISLRELDAAQEQIDQQRSSLGRQLHQERSITRADYATQINELMQLETQLAEKRKSLTGGQAA